MERYLSMRSHHTVRGRRLRVRRALGTRRTLWHRTQEMEQKRSAVEEQRKKQGYCRARDSLSARNKVWRACKNKMLISLCCILHRRDVEERSKQMISLVENRQRWRGCVLFCLSVKRLRGWCIQHVISANFPELTVSIKLYTITRVTTVNTGTALMLLIWQSGT